MIRLESTQVPLSKVTRARLKSICYKDQTYDRAINQLIDFSLEFNNEREFHRWVEENIELLGFDRVVKSNSNRFPDIIAERDGELVNIEIETFSENFLLHGHDPNKCDLVICLVDNTELPVKTLKIDAFSLTPRIYLHKYPHSKTISLDQKHIDWLDKECINFSKLVRKWINEEMDNEGKK